MTASEAPKKIRLGVSACLLGEPVRYDGNHRQEDLVSKGLARVFELVPVCPEMAIGLGVPRDPLHLQRDSSASIHMIETTTGREWTQVMRRFGREKVEELSQLGIRGYVFKARSPSCGRRGVPLVDRVKQDHRGSNIQYGRGLFADAVLSGIAGIPAEDEEGLQNTNTRESFLERVLAFDRLSLFLEHPWRTARLVEFQAREKLLLMAHSPERQRELGRLVAARDSLDSKDLQREYRQTFMEALAEPASRGRHANVLRHAFGYISPVAPERTRHEIIEAIDEFELGKSPLATPKSLLQQSFGTEKIAYLQEQTYFSVKLPELSL